MIPFNRPLYLGCEDQYVLAAMRSPRMSGDGEFGGRCQSWFQEKTGCPRTLLTSSCTHALEMAALLLDVQPDDEVIMPSFTFASTANAFVLRGAKVVFVDIRPDTMNLDERLVEAAITSRTRAIVPVHYAGVACEMDTLLAIAQRHGLAVVEDAAQAMMASYKGRALGAIGDLGAYSFHEAKNFTSGGEGGLLLVNAGRYAGRAEIIREKGTNRSQFFRGMVEKYSWVDLGSSYLPCELQAAYLWGQLERAGDVDRSRQASWAGYYEALAPLQQEGRVELPVVPDGCQHNAHMFYLKVGGLDERSRFIAHMARSGVQAVFHYVPLHSSLAGARFGRFHGEDRFTTGESERLVRLPLWHGMTPAETGRVVEAVLAFFRQ